MTKIWHKDFTLQDLEVFLENTIEEHIGIRYTEVTDNSISAVMPVDKRTHQPFGRLHGGASVVLAESLGSMAGNLCVDMEKFNCVGQEINANHIRPVQSGFVKGTATPIHIGASSQIWEIKIVNEAV
jgi:1,4-dihydroxy-2-naphthoyl-CoA hydrolase